MLTEMGRDLIKMIKIFGFKSVFLLGCEQSPETEKNRFFGSVSVEPTRNRKRNRKHEKTDL
jgi:hypothetical protein